MYDKKNNFILVLSCFVLIVSFVINYTSVFPLRRPVPSPTPTPDKRLPLEMASNVGYIKSIVKDGKEAYLSFDPIIFRAGEISQQDYQELCADAPEQCFAKNGSPVIIRRNLTTKTQTFTVSPQVVLVTQSYYATNDAKESEKSCTNRDRLVPFDDWQTIFTGSGDAATQALFATTPFRLEINPQNEIVLIYEIYQP